MASENIQTSEVQIEIGCKALGIPERRRHAVVVFNYDGGVPETEDTEMFQLPKLNVQQVLVAPELMGYDWCDLTGLLSPEELSAIGSFLIQDMIEPLEEGNPVH